MEIGKWTESAWQVDPQELHEWEGIATSSEALLRREIYMIECEQYVLIEQFCEKELRELAVTDP